jgi:hypothetical protein
MFATGEKAYRQVLAKNNEKYKINLSLFTINAPRLPGR